MGIIEKQTIKGSFFSYLGVAFGFITVGLLWPRLLNPEEIGMINFLIAISAILAHVASLGINSVAVRLFPYFRNDKNRHNGFLSLALMFVSSGTVLVLLYYLIFKERIVENNMGKSALLAEYAWYILPFTIATLVYNLFDSLHKVTYNAVIGVFVKEFLFRIMNLVLIGLYAWFAFRFRLFLNLYFILFSLPALVLIIALYRKHQYNLKFNFGFITRDLRKNLTEVSFFGILGGMGTIAISNIDKIMINHFIDLEATGIYSIAFLFGSLITMPSRSLSKISTPIIAESWKRNDMDTIRSVYSKSCLNQFVFGGLVFLLVWMNLDVVFMIIPPEYAAGRFVILFVALNGVVEMATGLNGMIIAASKYYRYQSVFTFFLLFLVVVTNLIFIPRFGITGAALASFLSAVLYNAVRTGFLFLKFGMQPFNYRFLIILGTMLLTLLAGLLVKSLEHWMIRTLLNCLLVLVFFLGPILYFRISSDINNSLSNNMNHFMKRFRNKR